MKAPSLPSDLQALLRAEARCLQDRLHETSARLGTAQERADDLAMAQDVSQRLHHVQMALAGIAALRPAVKRAPEREEARAAPSGSVVRMF